MQKQLKQFKKIWSGTHRELRPMSGYAAAESLDDFRHMCLQVSVNGPNPKRFVGLVRLQHMGWHFGSLDKVALTAIGTQQNRRSDVVALQLAPKARREFPDNPKSRRKPLRLQTRGVSQRDSLLSALPSST